MGTDPPILPYADTTMPVGVDGLEVVRVHDDVRRVMVAPPGGLGRGVWFEVTPFAFRMAATGLFGVTRSAWPRSALLQVRVNRLANRLVLRFAGQDPIELTVAADPATTELVMHELIASLTVIPAAPADRQVAVGDGAGGLPSSQARSALVATSVALVAVGVVCLAVPPHVVGCYVLRPGRRPGRPGVRHPAEGPLAVALAVALTRRDLSRVAGRRSADRCRHAASSLSRDPPDWRSVAAVPTHQGRYYLIAGRSRAAPNFDEEVGRSPDDKRQWSKVGRARSVGSSRELRMSSKANGIGLFVRPATERTPYVASVAVDLGLRPTAPQLGRPWACRVSAALIRPGTSGLATDMVDVERLTELGRAFMDRLGDAAVLAGVVTTGGRRTWLLYAAGADVAGVTAAVRLAVRMAFAEQADYVPVVAVEHDPDWGGFLAMFPTEAELAGVDRRQAEAAEAAAIRSATDTAVAIWGDTCRDDGGHAEAVAIRYRLEFATEAARSLFLSRALACQFRPAPPRMQLASGTPAAGPMSVEIDRDGMVNAAAIHQIERWLMAEAQRVGGRYAGWAVPAVAASAVRLAA